MSDYVVDIEKHAQKDIRKLARDVQRRISDKIDDLENGHPNDAKKLKGNLDGQYRTRVGKYRIFYEVDDDEGVITVKKVCHREDCYNR